MAIQTMKTKVRALEKLRMGRAVIVWDDGDDDAAGLVADLLAEGEIDAGDQIVCVEAERETRWLH